MPEVQWKFQRTAVRIMVLSAAIMLSACTSGDDCDPEDVAECEVVAVTTQNVAGEASGAEGKNQNGNNSESATQHNGSTPPAGYTYSAADINHLVVVTGQSNVEAPETTYDPHLDHPDPRVFAFTDQGWRMADLYQVWDENAHPGNHALTDPTKSPNNNFVFHYGKSMTQVDPDAVVGFIVLAAPGKGIANWDYDSPFYVKMRDKINNALSQLPNRNQIDVMLWHQGESDSQYEGTSDPDATGFTDENSYEYLNYYAIKLRDVISNFRSESWGRSDLPFICGETRVSFRVNRRLLELNEDDDPNTFCVYTTDLPYRLSDPSGAHFSAAGLRELGRRYMQAYLDIINQ
jgi:hypothetical protein